MEPLALERHLQQSLDLIRASQFEEATRLLSDIVAQMPNHAVALRLMGMAHDLKGQSAIAVSYLKQSIASDPNIPESWNDLGLAQLSLKQRDEAEAAFRHALSLAPDYHDAMYNLARCMVANKQYAEALSWTKRLLHSVPQVPEIHRLMATIQCEMGNPDQAVIHAQHALRMLPDHPAILLDLAKATLLAGHTEQAMQHVRKATQLNRHPVSVWQEWAQYCEEKSHLTRAVDAYQVMVEYQPFDAHTWKKLGILHMGIGSLGDAMPSFEQAMMCDPEDLSIRSYALQCMHYMPEVTAEDISQKTKAWMQEVLAKTPVHSVTSRRASSSKLRVGLISSDLRNHPVGSFLLPLLVSTAPDEVEWIAYYNHTQEDFLTHAIRAQVSRFDFIAALTDAQVADRIRQDDLDILIELNGHTPRNRLRVMAMKPAPTQMSWLGYFNTTGVSGIDYLLCDNTVVKDEEFSRYTETPIRLPDSYLCFAPPGFAMTGDALPALKNTYVTFGSLNYFTKITDAVIDVWASILARVEHSRLLLKTPSLADPELRESVVARFAAHGITRSRLQLESGAPQEEFMRAYQRIDIALDPFPYNGGTTTAEALWMGVPVLTLSGEHFVSRVSHTMLAQLDMLDWVTFDTDSYIRTAIQKASDIHALASLREQLRDRLMESHLCNAPRFAKHMIETLRSLVTRPAQMGVKE